MTLPWLKSLPSFGGWILQFWKGRKMYRVRCTLHGVRCFIQANGYRDALRIKQRFGGKILGGKR